MGKQAVEGRKEGEDLLSASARRHSFSLPNARTIITTMPAIRRTKITPTRTIPLMNALAIMIAVVSLLVMCVMVWWFVMCGVWFGGLLGCCG